MKALVFTLTSKCLSTSRHPTCAARYHTFTFMLFVVLDLHFPERVEFKLCSVVYKCLHDSAPRYLSQYYIPVASLPGRSHLRSATSGDLFVPATSTKTIGPRGFSHAGPTAWNCLPSSMKDPNITFSVFKKLLKTELFQH